MLWHQSSRRIPHRGISFNWLTNPSKAMNSFVTLVLPNDSKESCTKKIKDIMRLSIISMLSQNKWTHSICVYSITKTCQQSMFLFYKPCDSLKWVDLGWAPAAQQATPSFPFSAGEGRRNKMENSSQVMIRQFTKPKVKGCRHKKRRKKKRKKKDFVLYFPISKPCLVTSWEATLPHVQHLHEKSKIANNECSPLTPPFT